MTRGLLQLRVSLIDVQGEAGDEQRGHRLQRHHHAQWTEQPRGEPSMPRRGMRGREHTVDEAERRALGAEPLKRGDGAAEALEFLAAARACGEMGFHHRPCVGAELAVHQRREEIPAVLAGHVRKGSSLSLISIRARCSRERTVPGSRSSAVAISS